MVSVDLAYEDLMSVQNLVESLESSVVKSLYHNCLAATELEGKNYEETIIATTLAQELTAKGKDEWLNYSNLNILGAVYRD